MGWPGETLNFLALPGYSLVQLALVQKTGSAADWRGEPRYRDVRDRWLQATAGEVVRAQLAEVWASRLGATAGHVRLLVMDVEPQRAAGSDLREEQTGGPWQLRQDGRYYSPGGRYWWDGRIWRPLPRGPIGRWAITHPATYPFIVATVVGVGWGVIRLSMTVAFGGAVPSAIVLAYWAGVPGLIAWFVARGQLKQWGVR